MLLKKIHIVEDQMIIALDLQHLLEDVGYEVCGLSTNFDDAIERISAVKPDLILLDIILMGDKTGIDLANEINQHYQIPFVYLTSHADQLTEQAAMATQPVDYLIKPYNRNDILATIEYALS